MWKWLPELIALPLMPLLGRQGKRTRATTPRLPEAAGARSGIMRPPGEPGTGTAALTIIGIGESPIAGVGVATQAQALTAQMAAALASLRHDTVAWHTFAKNGATVSDALHLLCPGIPDTAADIVLIGFGVNDTTAFRPPAQYSRDLRAMIALVRQRHRPRWIVLSGVPPLQDFPALPWPLRSILGLKSRVLDQAAGVVACVETDVLHVPFTLDARAPGLMASDGYHPSAAGAAQWGASLAQAVHAHMSQSNSRQNPQNM